MSVTWKKRIIFSALSAVAIVVATAAYSFFAAWNRFASEDRFYGTLYPVVSAIDEFQHDKGFFPTNLTQLVPRYLQAIPGAPVADSVDYEVLPDRTNWQLSVRGRVTGTSRLLPPAFISRLYPPRTTTKRWKLSRMAGIQAMIST